MKVSELTASKYLSKTDFEDDQTVIIKGIRLEELDDNGQKKEKTVCYFREHAKGMILNVTSLRVLAQSFGDETDDWRGRQVIVYTDPNVSFGGRIVGGLRLRIPKQQKPPSEPKPKTVAEQTDDFDDPVPF